MNEKARPGDKIVITTQCSLVDREFLVTECPKKYAGSSVDTNGSTWTTRQCNGIEVANAWAIQDYRIVKHTSSPKNSVNVDESLSRQMNDNLRDVFS